MSCEPGCVRRLERLDQNRRLRHESPAPARVDVEELRPSERDEHGPGFANVRGEVREQVELARLRPVDVLEHEERRLHETERLDEASRGKEQQLHLLRARLVAHAQQEPEIPSDIGRLFRR